MSKAFFWDVQHGHATTVISPNGRVFVVDLGQGSLGSFGAFSPLNTLYKEGFQTIECLIISHPHLDHIDDILNLKKFDLRTLMIPSHLMQDDFMNNIRNEDLPKFEYYLRLQQSFTGRDLRWGDPIQRVNFSGLLVQFFAPSTCSRSNINNHSIVTVFEESTVKIVIPGDNEACSFNELLNNPAFCAAVADADVLLAPHHGRKAGVHSEFLKLVNPKLCIISDGRATETNAVNEYSKIAHGATIQSQSKGQSTRYCLSTRKDGMIEVNFGKGILAPTLQVETY